MSIIRNTCQILAAIRQMFLDKIVSCLTGGGGVAGRLVGFRAKGGGSGRCGGGFGRQTKLNRRQRQRRLV